MTPLIDTPSTNPDDLSEHVDEEPAVDPDTGKKILRPRNAWILFRNEMLDRVPRLPDGSRQPMADASKIISAWWKQVSPEEKYRYELQAEQEKEEHKRKYPNYRFQPKSKMQKAKEKAAKREAVKKAQLQSKVKTRASTPPQAYATSHATSYLAAALANQANQTAATTPMPAYGREGPSPPLSLASTPTTTPSPFPLSDFEQGSSTSTSATSAQALPSPSDALGLGLPSPLNFNGQDEANARVPQRPPARLPPRKKGPKIKTDLSSEATSFSSSAARAQTPATGTPSALSPLPWPLPNDDARQPPPQSREPSPASSTGPPSAPSSDLWDVANSYNPVSGCSDNLSLDLNLAIPDPYSEDFFNHISFGASALHENEGIFSMSMDSFAGHQLPDQFDVSLTASAPMIASDLSQSFSDFLNTFDFRAHSGDPLQDPSPPHVDTVPELDPSPEIWQMWTRTDNASSDVLPSAALTAGHELPPYDQMHMEQSMVQESTPSADYLHTFPEVVHEESIQAQGPPQVQQQPDSSQRLAIPSHYPPHLAEDPDFVEVYAQYVSKMQQRCIQANAHAGPHHDHLTYTPQDQPQSQVTHDEVQYQAQAYTPNGLHHTSYSEPQPLSPPSSTSGDVHCGSGYVPPSGAATTIGLRRVGGTWRPPVGPPPSEDSTSRVPSWGSVAST